jgi:hypothetical protein
MGRDRKIEVVVKLDSYLTFLEMYWQMFEPPTEPKPPMKLTRVLL